MEIVKGYFDYNVSDQVLTSNFSKTANVLKEYGYRTIAINRTLREEDFKKVLKRKKKGDPFEIVPPPRKFKKIEGLKVLNRLTIRFSTQDDMYKVMKSKNYQLYDIIAVLPCSQNAFQFVCNSMDCDILCFDPHSNRLPFKLTRKLYKKLVDKGIHFEICYVPTIMDKSMRKSIISIAHLLYTFGKSQNVILSSETVSPYTVRPPYDIINLCHILGLNEAQAKNSILNNGRNVFIHSVRRKIGKPLLFPDNLLEVNNTEKEVIKEERDEDEEEEMDIPDNLLEDNNTEKEVIKKKRDEDEEEEMDIPDNLLEDNNTEKEVIKKKRDEDEQEEMDIPDNLLEDNNTGSEVIKKDCDKDEEEEKDIGQPALKKIKL